MQEHARQQRHVLQAAKAAGLSNKLSVADAQQVLGCDDPAACLTALAAAPAPAADVFLSEPFYSSLESLPPWSQLRSFLPCPSSPLPPPPSLLSCPTHAHDSSQTHSYRQLIPKAQGVLCPIHCASLSLDQVLGRCVHSQPVSIPADLQQTSPFIALPMVIRVHAQVSDW